MKYFNRLKYLYINHVFPKLLKFEAPGTKPPIVTEGLKQISMHIK